MPAAFAIRLTILAAAWRSSPFAVVAVEDRAFEAFSHDEIDRSRGTRGERHDNGLAAFAHHRQRAMPALEGEVLDSGADRFGHAETIQRQQRDQGVITRPGETGFDEHRPELVAVESNSVGLVVQLRAAHVHGRGVFDQSFLFGVPVEAGDRAQPSCDRRSRSTARLEFACERFDVSPARLEQSHPDRGHPPRELAEIERVGVAGETGIAGQESTQCERLGIGEQLVAGTRQYPVRFQHDDASNS
ncbi:MAG TPA: hypothetical protein VE505_20145 [Vicinamibacterales bacterium]|nr:hypothetical protein [Vicinamibacterales bacterium]